MTLASESLPLSGLKVLSVEFYGAGPFCTQYLSTFGADVIKIENSTQGGDFARTTGPNSLGPEDSLYFQSFNQGKRSLSLDLKDKKGKEVLHRLVAKSDVITNNLRGDKPEQLGLTYSVLKEVNPKIVCTHLSAYGRNNERSAWPGFDYLMQAEAGWMELTGEIGSNPQRAGLSLVDYMTGMNNLFAIMMGVFYARNSGQGCDFDVSLLDTAIFQLSYPALWSLNEQYDLSRQPRSAHPESTPSQLVRTKNGWIFLMCQTEKFWKVFCELMDEPSLTENSEYQTMADRRCRREQISEELDQIFLKHTTEEWLERFQGKIPVAPINDLREALENPFIRKQGMIQKIDHPTKPEMQVLSNPIKWNQERMTSHPGPHKVGENTQAILKEFGFSEAEISELQAEGVV